MFSTNQLQIELYLNNALQPFKSMSIDKKNYDQQINLNNINLRELNISEGTHIINVVVTDMDNGNSEMVTINLTVTGDVETGDGVLNLVEETSWKIGYVDPRAADEEIESQIHRKYRTFDIASKNWIEMIKSEIEPAYNCVCLFDGVNKLINVYHIDTLSEDKGFYISEKNYLKHIKKEPKFGEIYTKLNIYGKDNMSINSINPSGKSYILDFSYYMNEPGYMTDSLKNAIIAYNALLYNNKGQFKIYLNQLKEQQTILTTKETEMSTLENELTIIQDDIDLAIQASQDLTTLNASKAAKESEIANKQLEIDGVNAQIQSIQNSITSLATLLDEKNNFTPEQWDELDNFIEEKDWQDSRIFEVDELYKAGQDALKKLNSPQLDFDIEMADFFSMVEGDSELDHNKMTMGNIVYIGFEKLSIDIAQRLVGYTHDVDGHSLKGNFTNRDKKDDAMRQLTDSISQAINAGVSVGMNKGIWDKSDLLEKQVDEIINGNLDAAKNAVLAGKNQSVRIDERGIALMDMLSPQEQMRIISNVLCMTTDGWQTADLAITPHGVVAKKLIGEILLGQLLRIADETGQFVIDGNLLTVKDQLNRIRVLLGNYDKINGKYGLKLMNKTGTETVLSEDGIAQCDSIYYANNCDASHPLVMKVYIDDDTLSIQKAKLSISRLPFRAYSSSTASGGSSTVTSASGGSTTSSTQPAMTTNYFLDYNGNVVNPDDFSYLTDFGGSSGGTHTHSFRIKHGHQIPSHDHTIDSHQHSVSIGSHAHGMVYQIYEDSLPTDLRIWVDGQIADGSAYNSDVVIDLTQNIVGTGWHTIEVTTATRGLISCGLFIKSFVGM